MSPVHGALTGTLLLLLALMLLGLNLQLGWRPGPARLVHHGLYFLICVGTVVTGALAVRGGQAWWPYVFLLALLLGMSRTRPGRPGHWRLAVVISVLYLGAAWWLW
jgi:hypothetical protein